MNDEKLLTRKEAAAFLGLKVQTLFVWSSKGGNKAGLPYVKWGHSVRYRQSDLIEFLNRHTKGKSPSPLSNEEGAQS